MSELDHVLELFGFLSIDDVTAESLKKAFKVQVLKVHPDKGGQAQDFDKLLGSFVYLSETFQRINGGRATLQNVISPDVLKGMRPDELVNRVFEEFDNAEFNKKFEENHQKTIHGYTTWLKNEEDLTNLTDGQFGNATQKPPTFDEKVLNIMFEFNVRSGKTAPSAIILHPEQMAYNSSKNIGTDIIESNTGPYTSDVFTNPEYTDVYAAFNTDNTISDKVSDFIEPNKSLSQLLEERQQELSSTIVPLDDKELQAIQDFEKKKLEQDTKNLANIKEYFNNTGREGSLLDNWPPSSYPKEEYKGFIKEL